MIAEKFRRNRSTPENQFQTYVVNTCSRLEPARRAGHNHVLRDRETHVRRPARPVVCDAEIDERSQGSWDELEQARGRGGRTDCTLLKRGEARRRVCRRSLRQGLRYESCRFAPQQGAQVEHASPCFRSKSRKGKQAGGTWNSRRWLQPPFWATLAMVYAAVAWDQWKKKTQEQAAESIENRMQAGSMQDSTVAEAQKDKSGNRRRRKSELSICAPRSGGSGACPGTRE